MQHDRVAVGLLRSDVEIAHVQRLALRVEIEALDGPGVIETLQLRPVDGRIGRGEREEKKPAHGAEIYAARASPAAVF
jgi:hypothetical protein